MGHGPIYNLGIEVIHLGLYILRHITAVLIIYGTHNDFQFIRRLIINYISLRLTKIKDSLANELLNALNICTRKEGSAHRCGLPVSTKHIGLKIRLDRYFWRKSGKTGVRIRKCGSIYGDAAVLSGRARHGKYKIRRCSEQTLFRARHRLYL